MKVLVLGSLPKWKGGIHKTGLSTGIFDLHDAVNSLHEDIEITIAASDVYKKSMFVDHTPVIGWTKSQLILHALKRFYRLPLFFRGALYLKKFNEVFSFSRTLIKLLFLDYAVEKVKPDIVHLHGCGGACYRNYIWKKEIPVVLRIHGINGFDSTIRGYQQYREIEKSVTAYDFKFVTFVTSAICEEWKEKYGSFKCPMIPLINGYNSTVFYPSQTDVEKKYDLITFSGLSERKGQDRVLKAIRILAQGNNTLSYLIVGSGDVQYEKKLKEYVSQNELNVKFIEYCSQDQINKYLWESRFFILPSATEGFGKVFIESIAGGVPVILPQTLPIAKEKGVLNQFNSILIEDESVDSIVKGLKSLSSINMAKPSDISSSVSHLSWVNLAKQYINLYHTI